MLNFTARPKPSTNYQFGYCVRARCVYKLILCEQSSVQLPLPLPLVLLFAISSSNSNSSMRLSHLVNFARNLLFYLRQVFCLPSCSALPSSPLHLLLSLKQQTSEIIYILLIAAFTGEIFAVASPGIGIGPWHLPGCTSLGEHNSAWGALCCCLSLLALWLS